MEIEVMVIMWYEPDVHDRVFHSFVGTIKAREFASRLSKDPAVRDTYIYRFGDDKHREPCDWTEHYHLGKLVERRQ